MNQHPDTIGVIEWDGKSYEIDWPFELDDETSRDPLLAVVYEEGRQVAELPLPGFGEIFTSEEQVMEIAFDFIAGGGLDE